MQSTRISTYTSDHTAHRPGIMIGSVLKSIVIGGKRAARETSLERTNPADCTPETAMCRDPPTGLVPPCTRHSTGRMLTLPSQRHAVRVARAARTSQQPDFTLPLRARPPLCHHVALARPPLFMAHTHSPLCPIPSVNNLLSYVSMGARHELHRPLHLRLSRDRTISQPEHSTCKLTQH